MLSPDEIRWWPLAPLLLAQGLYVRLRSERLPSAEQALGRIGSGRRDIRLAGVGDSIIAGIGVSQAADGLVGQVARRLASQADATVSWRATGESGATVLDVLERMLDAAVREDPSLLIISVGVNDAVAGTAPATFKARLREVVDRVAAGPRRAVIFAGIPPLASFPALPRPLATLLGQRAAALAAAAAALDGHRGMKVVAFPATLDRAGFARDGFHPGPQACARWAEWVVEALPTERRSARRTTPG